MVSDLGERSSPRAQPPPPRVCGGCATARDESDAIAAVLQREMEIAEAEAVVKLTLTELAHRHLLEVPAESRGGRPAPTRRWLLGRGLKAAMLPAVYTILDTIASGGSIAGRRTDADQRHAESRHPGLLQSRSR